MITMQENELILSNISDSIKLTNEIVRESPYFVIVTDISGNAIYANTSALSLFRLDDKLILGKNINEIMPISQNRNTIDEISNHIHLANPWNGEIWITLPDRTELVIELHVTIINFETDGRSETDFVLYMGRNITAQKSLQRQSIQAEKMAVRGDMAGEIAHELNNYLSVVYGNLELLGMALEKGAYQGLPNRVKSMKDGLDRMTKFVEGLMYTPKQVAMKESVDINRFLRSEIMMIKALPQFSDIEFVYNFETELPSIEADKGQLQQVITHIINNAYDALVKKGSQDKKIGIATSFSSVDNHVKIVISDNGCGMADADYGRLFKQLFTTKKAGHGFNLLTIKGIIKSHGGKIIACRGRENGASFVIELPCSD